jgi:signal transduction histidine kinase
VTELFALASLLGEQTSGPEHPVVPLSALTLAATLLGRNRRARAALVADLQDRAERAERERDSLARAAVAEERTRIAREVHDVVSHNLSVMTALADGAGYALRTGTGPARAQAADAVAAVATTGREALGEMHRLLGLLRADDTDDTDAAARRPAPGLAELPALVDQVRAAGLPTTLVLGGRPVPLGTAAQLAVYRLVQEALTNTRKHAPGASAAEVRLEWSDGGLTVRVRDDGPPADAAAGVGHGLIGMRERFGAHGGSVSAGPAAPRGWLVEATLPLPGGPLPAPARTPAGTQAQAPAPAPGR